MLKLLNWVLTSLKMEKQNSGDSAENFFKMSVLIGYEVFVGKRLKFYEPKFKMVGVNGRLHFQKFF